MRRKSIGSFGRTINNHLTSAMGLRMLYQLSALIFSRRSAEPAFCSHSEPPARENSHRASELQKWLEATDWLQEPALPNRDRGLRIAPQSNSGSFKSHTYTSYRRNAPLCVRVCMNLGVHLLTTQHIKPFFGRDVVIYFIIDHDYCGAFFDKEIVLHKKRVDKGGVGGVRTEHVCKYVRTYIHAFCSIKSRA